MLDVGLCALCISLESHGLVLTFPYLGTSEASPALFAHGVEVKGLLHIVKGKLFNGLPSSSDHVHFHFGLNISVSFQGRVTILPVLDGFFMKFALQVKLVPLDCRRESGIIGINLFKLVLLFKRRCPCFSEGPEATSRSRPLKGAVSSQNAFQGSET